MRFFGIQSEKYIFFPTLYPYTIGVPGKWYFLEHISARDTQGIRKGYAERDCNNCNNCNTFFSMCTFSNFVSRFRTF